MERGEAQKKKEVNTSFCVLHYNETLIFPTSVDVEFL